MVRHILIAVVVAVASVAVQAEGQERLVGQWRLDFGAKPLPEPAPVRPMHHDLTGPQRPHGPHSPAPTPHHAVGSTGLEGAFLQGIKTIPLPAQKPAIDCAMVKPGDSTID